MHTQANLDNIQSGQLNIFFNSVIILNNVSNKYLNTVWINNDNWVYRNDKLDIACGQLNLWVF